MEICIFPTSGKPVMEYLPLAKLLVLGRSYALGTILLTSAYQALSKYVSDEPYHRVGCALWFVQTWLFAYFPEFSSYDITSLKTLGLHVMRSLRTMPFDDLTAFFLGLADRALLYLFLKPDYVHLLAWNQTLASSQPYLHDFETFITFTSTTCRVLISGGCFAFYTLLSASSASLQPYLPCI